MARKQSRPVPKKIGGISLSVKRGPNASGSWYYRLMWWNTSEGARTRVTRSLGWLTAEDADEALMAAAQGQDDEPEPDHAEDTVSDLLGAWLVIVEASPRSANTKRHYRYCVTRLNNGLGTHPVAFLGYSEMEAYVSVQASSGYSKRTIAQDLIAMGAAWKWAAKAGHLSRTLDMPRVTPKRGEYAINHRTPTDDEVSRTLEVYACSWKGDILRLTWATGSRIGAICELTWDQVDLEARSVTLDTKNGIVELPLGAPAMALLTRRHTAQGEPLTGQVFPEHVYTRRTTSAVRSALLQACKVAGVKPWTAHGLRRLAVDTMARAGVDVATAASITGHSEVTMLRYYRKITMEDQRRALAMAGLGQVKHEPPNLRVVNE